MRCRKSLTTKDAKAAKEQKSLNAKAAKDAKENKSLNAKDAKAAKKSTIKTKGAKTTPSGNLDTDSEMRVRTVRR